MSEPWDDNDPNYTNQPYEDEPGWVDSDAALAAQDPLARDSGYTTRDFQSPWTDVPEYQSQMPMATRELAERWAERDATRQPYDLSEDLKQASQPLDWSLNVTGRVIEPVQYTVQRDYGWHPAVQASYRPSLSLGDPDYAASLGRAPVGRDYGYQITGNPYLDRAYGDIAPLSVNPPWSSRASGAQVSLGDPMLDWYFERSRWQADNPEASGLSRWEPMHAPGERPDPFEVGSLRMPEAYLPEWQPTPYWEPMPTYRQNPRRYQ